MSQKLIFHCLKKKIFLKKVELGGDQHLECRTVDISEFRNFKYKNNESRMIRFIYFSIYFSFFNFFKFYKHWKYIYDK